MSMPKLIYFDAPVSRGEECRLALHVAGVEFDDVRIARDAWPGLKPKTPFGALPILEVPGQVPLAQSNAILGYIGRKYGLHPQDLFEAARHEAMLGHVEDLRAAIVPTIRMTDESEKKKAREGLTAAFLPSWGDAVERQLSGGPFFAGAKMHVVDLKLYMVVRWLASGNVDHIPATIFSALPKLTRLYEAVRDDARIKAWYAKK